MNHEQSWGMRAVGTVVAVILVQWAFASAVASADPGPPPGPAGSGIAGRCTQYEPALSTYAPPGGWDVAMMSAFMWRESKCTPTVRSATLDTGLLQINDVNHAHLRAVLGEWVGRWSLTDPNQNIKAAAALCTFWQGQGKGCYYPWKIPPIVAPVAPVAAPAAPAVAAPVAPVASSTARRCTQYEPALAANAPAGGWNVDTMSRLMWTMSRCKPSTSGPTSTGLLRISNVNTSYLGGVLGQKVTRQSLADPTQNIRAAAALCVHWRTISSCYAPWGGTG